MNHYVNPKFCIPFANGDCASGETCPLRHDVFKCSCGRVLPLRSQEKHMNSSNHSRNLAALKTQSEAGDNSASPTPPAFRVGYATTAHSKCEGSKSCSGTLIPMGGLQFGVFVEIGGRKYFSWRHWGCVKKTKLRKARRQFSEASEIAGFESLQPADQAKVTRAWLNGAVADEDITECMRKPTKLSKVSAEKERNETAAEEEAPQMIASISKDAYKEGGLEVDDALAGLEEVNMPKVAPVKSAQSKAKASEQTHKYIAPGLPKVKATYCVPFANGHCELGQTCHLRHDIFKCSCGRILSLAVQTVHLRSKNHFQHLANLQTESTGGGSFVLNATGGSGQSPQEIAEYATVPLADQQSRGHDDTPSFDQPQQPVKCVHCGKYIENASYDLHVEEHLRQQRCAQLEAELETAAEDQQGVTVSGRLGVDFGIVDPESTVEATISVHSALSRVVLRACRMRPSTRKGEHGGKFSAQLQGNSRTVYPGATRKVLIVMHPSFPGYFEDTLELVFYNIDEKSKFVITRKVEATIGSQEDHTLLGAKAPYERQQTVKFNPTGPIVPSVQSPIWTNTPWALKLPLFKPPADLVEAASTPKGRALNAVKQFMPAQFDKHTYGAWFQILLYVEEEKMKSDLDAYALSAVELTLADDRHYNLVVQGLAENRPSVLVGDLIFVSCTETDATINSRTWYEGRVYEVHAQHVSLQFGHSFSMYKGTKFDVRFMLNRLTFRRMHQTLTNKFDPPRLLFPGPEHIRGVARVTADKISQITPSYRPLGEDAEQMETVAAIVNQKPGSVPFVIFGPPGTGKTVTIVEAIRQLLAKDPSIRILACAPSNSAADNIAMKLLVLGPTQVFRLNALSRKVNDMPKILRPIAKVDDNSTFAIPDIEQLARYRVIVSTCYSGGVPAGLGLKSGHFSHIFIDEAGQGREPEVMVAIKGNANSKTNVILAGDIHQLGPIVHSPLAASLGLGISYLHRIMQRPIYNLNTGKGITIVKLVKSFRSHPDIFQYSNDQFYNSELQSCGNPVITRSLINYEKLPKAKFPLIFHGIVGKDEREERSPSFFNVDEITLVKKYCVSLIGDKKNGIKAEHIGVITPYHAQRCKISKLLHRDPKLSDIKVGSVEEFQGQERRVIIISTVRSNKEYIASDIKRSLGFVANKQRLNVALTRAQALLIVIGNPTVLSLDPIWKGFLNFVHLRGGWTGKKIDWDPQEPVSSTIDYALERRKIMEAQLEDTVARLRSMIISRHEDNRYGVEVEEDDEAGSFERPILREHE